MLIINRAISNAVLYTELSSLLCIFVIKKTASIVCVYIKTTTQSSEPCRKKRNLQHLSFFSVGFEEGVFFCITRTFIFDGNNFPFVCVCLVFEETQTCGSLSLDRHSSNRARLVWRDRTASLLDVLYLFFPFLGSTPIVYIPQLCTVCFWNLSLRNSSVLVLVKIVNYGSVRFYKGRSGEAGRLIVARLRCY